MVSQWSLCLLLSAVNSATCTPPGAKSHLTVMVQSHITLSPPSYSAFPLLRLSFPPPLPSHPPPRHYNKSRPVPSTTCEHFSPTSHLPSSKYSLSSRHIVVPERSEHRHKFSSPLCNPSFLQGTAGHKYARNVKIKTQSELRNSVCVCVSFWFGSVILKKK